MLGGKHLFLLSCEYSSLPWNSPYKSPPLYSAIMCLRKGMNPERSAGTNQNKTRLKSISAPTNLDMSVVTFQGKSAKMLLKNTQFASLFKNVPQLTFLSADLCPTKFARTFLNQFPNSFPGISVSEPKKVCHDVPNEVSNNVQRKQCTQAPVQDCKQVPREDCTSVPVQKCYTVCSSD